MAELGITQSILRDAGGNVILDLTQTNVASTLATGPLGLEYQALRDIPNWSGSSITTTGSMTAGQTSLAVASIEDFKVGQGISVVGAGQVADPSSALTLSEYTSLSAYGVTSGFVATDTVHVRVAFLDANGNSTNVSPDASITMSGANAVRASFTFPAGAMSANVFVGSTASGTALATITKWGAITFSGSATQGIFAHQSAGTMTVTIYEYSNAGAAQPSSNTTTAYLVSEIVAISGTTITLADAASHTVSNATVYHDDSTALQNFINNTVPFSGSIIRFPISISRYAKDITVKANMHIRGYSVGDSYGNGSALWMANGATCWLQAGVTADLMRFEGDTPALSPRVCFNAPYAGAGRIEVDGDDTTAANTVPACAIMGQGPGGYAYNCHIDALVTEGGTALWLQYATESRIDEWLADAWTGSALVFDWSDNMTFGHVELNNPVGGNTVNVIVIGWNQYSQSFGNHFDYLNIAHPSGKSDFEVNFSDFVSGGLQEPTTVDHYIPNTAPTFTFNNSSYGMLLVRRMDLGNIGLYFPQPPLPSGTGIGNAYQNQTASPLGIYMTGQSGTHVVSAAYPQTDHALGVDPSYFRLMPGDKIYFATTVPSAWYVVAEV